MATYDLTVAIPSRVVAGDILNCPYSGTAKSIALPKGHYKLECWGAEGGGSRLSGNTAGGVGGLGGYSYGTLTLDNKTTVYLYSGRQGDSSDTGMTTPSFNGGGVAWSSGASEPANSGGGASDVRIGADSLYARVIVAGGGGGGGEDGSDTVGHGGGTSGTGNQAASQTGSGTGGVFGAGANTANDGGGGGGGWYGGGTAGGSQSLPTGNSTSDTSGGGGGSGYVYTSSTASSYPSGCLLNTSMYLTNASTAAGNTSFTSPTGGSESGHRGNGYVRITVIDAARGGFFMPRVGGQRKQGCSEYVKVSGTWREIEGVFVKANGAWRAAGG